MESAGRCKRSRSEAISLEHQIQDQHSSQGPTDLTGVNTTPLVPAELTFSSKNLVQSTYARPKSMSNPTVHSPAVGKSSNPSDPTQWQTVSSRRSRRNPTNKQLPDTSRRFHSGSNKRRSPSTRKTSATKKGPQSASQPSEAAQENRTVHDPMANSNMNTLDAYAPSPTRWTLPAPETCKINVDAGMISDGRATIGGLIRSHSGHWIIGFFQMLPHMTVLEAELRAILTGLQLLQQGVRRYSSSFPNACQPTYYVLLTTVLTGLRN